MNRLLKQNLPLILVFASWLFMVSTAWAEPMTLATAQFQAAQSQLAQQAQWQILLHYQQDSSLVTDADFFLDPTGASDSQAELNATLAAFFQPTPDDDASPQCRFPARFAWLQQQLKFQVPIHRCEKLHNWLKNLAISGITLVFPVAYLNNPASLFGHSFLRLDSAHSELMAWTVNYAAVTAQERGLTFALKGLFGGYAGQFSLAPYYVLLKEYADLESRDLWEYRLNFSPAEQQRLLLHLWEVQNVSFDYYFINKNCSFQLLSLLEAARPTLHLTEQFQWDAIPADTVRAVTAVPDLLQSVHYRPALATQVAAKATALTDAQQAIAQSLAQGELAVENQLLKQLSPPAQAKTLELAFAYLSYLNASKIKHQQALDGQLAYALLAARSQLPTLTAEPPLPPPAFRPDQGHAGNRVQIASGYDGNAPYAQLGFRWSYHDAFDPAEGFTTASQVEFFKPSVRYYPQQQRVQLEALDLININSMPARNSFMQPFSWQIALGVNRQRFPAHDRALVGSLQAGGGVSYCFNEKILLSASALSSILVSDKFKQATAVGFGSVLYGQYDISTAWRVGAEARAVHYVQGIRRTAYRYALTQRLTISPAHALVFNIGRDNEFDHATFTGQIAWQIYF